MSIQVGDFVDVKIDAERDYLYNRLELRGMIGVPVKDVSRLSVLLDLGNGIWWVNKNVITLSEKQAGSTPVSRKIALMYKRFEMRKNTPSFDVDF